MFTIQHYRFLSLIPSNTSNRTVGTKPTGQHDWHSTRTVPIGDGECCTEFYCASCGAWKEEISGNGCSGWWGEGDYELHQERGGDDGCGEAIWAEKYSFLDAGISEDVIIRVEDSYADMFCVKVEEWILRRGKPRIVKIGGSWYELSQEMNYYQNHPLTYSGSGYLNGLRKRKKTTN